MERQKRSLRSLAQLVAIHATVLSSIAGYPLFFVLLFTAGCDYGLSLPSDDPKPDGPPSAGQVVPMRLRKALVPEEVRALLPKQARGLLPGTVTGPPPPDAGITADQCKDLNEGGPPRDDCLSGELHCGETLIGHTRGGVSRYNTRFYEANFCTPATTQHNGGDERVYLLNLPDPQTRAIVYLDTPCANLDLAALKHSGSTCPDQTSNLPQCEMWPKPGTKREKVDLYNNDPAQWWIVVEGQGEEEGAFALTVQCEKW